MSGEKSISRRLKQLEIGLGHLVGKEGGVDPLPFSQASVLSFLAERAGVETTIGQIEKRFNIANPTASGLVKRLLAKGLVTVEAPADDKRRRHVAITEAGRVAVRAADERMARVDAKLLEGFDAAERAQLYRLLDKLEGNLEK